MINKTHSKKDLIKINNTFDCGIINANQYKKNELSKRLETIIWNMEKIEPNDEYCFSNLIDLKYYLMNTNPKKLLTIKQKNELILNCKRIKHYCNNSFELSKTEFTSKEEVFALAQECSMFADIPSVRKMIKSLNADPDKLFTIVPNISKPMIKEIELKKKLKNTSSIALIVKRAPPGKPFIVSFD